MANRIRTRLAREESGFTLIELLVVIIILGILLAIAIPSYLSFKDRAQKTAAAADVRAAVPSISSYAADNTPSVATVDDPDYVSTDTAGTGSNADNGYTGMTWTHLQQRYDTALASSVYIMGDGDTAHPAPSITGLPTTYPISPGSSTTKTAPTDTTYCVWSVNGSWYAWKDGDQGNIKTSNAVAQVCQS